MALIWPDAVKSYLGIWIEEYAVGSKFCTLWLKCTCLSSKWMIELYWVWESWPKVLLSFGFFNPVLSWNGMESLQSQDFPTLQLAVLQPDFLREVAKVVGTAGYLEHLHFLVLANLRRSPDGRLEEPAAEVLISMSPHLGLPITLHQVPSHCLCYCSFRKKIHMLDKNHNHNISLLK